MWILIASLLVLGILAAIAGILRNRSLARKLANGEIQEMPEVKMVLDCGADSCELDEGNSCDLECMTPVIKQHIDYYDDEKDEDDDEDYMPEDIEMDDDNDY